MDGRADRVPDLEFRNWLPRPALVLGPAPFDTEPEPLRVAGKAVANNIAVIAIRVGLELVSAQFLDKFDSAFSIKDESELTIKRGLYQWMAGRIGATELEFGDQQTPASPIKVQDRPAIQIKREQVHAFRRNEIAKELRQSRSMGDFHLRIHQHAIEQQH